MNASSSIARPKLLVFASGTKHIGQNGQGGSGFENLAVASRTGVLDTDIIAVASNYEHGSVRNRATRLGIPFLYFPGPYNAENYSSILQNTRIDWIALSGWYKQVRGLDPSRTFNIHPALLSFDGGRFGGQGMYRHYVHEAVKKAFDAGEITESGFTMHFVTDEYDRGPAFFEYRVPLRRGMSALEIEKAVNKAEHEWQPKITNMVVHGEIRWDGKNPKSLVVPNGYKHLPKH